MTTVLVAVVSYNHKNQYDVVVEEDSDDAYAWMVFVGPQQGGGEGLLEVVVAVAAAVSPAEVFL